MKSFISFARQIGKTQSSSAGRIGLIVLVGLCYFVAARAGFAFAIVHSKITTIWPPSGIALAALLILGRWLAPGVFLGAFAANYSAGIPLWVSFGIAGGNSVAAFAGADLLRRLAGFRSDFSRIKDVVSFAGIAMVLNCLISASLGVSCLYFSGQVPSANLARAWIAWWSGDAVGVLIVAPLFFAIHSTNWKVLSLKSTAEAFLLAVCALLVTFFVFAANEDFLFLIFPLSVWAAIRFRNLGVSALAVLLASIAFPFLMARVAPESQQDKASVLWLIYRLQFFLTSSTLTGMLLAADITSRERAEAKLAEKEEQLQLIIGSTPDHVIMQDHALRYTLVVNPQLGLTKEEMLNRTDFDFLAPEDAKNLDEIKRGVMRSGVPLRLEVPLVSKSGTLEYFDGSYVPKRDEKGQVNGLIGYFRNVTDRKLAEKNRLAFEESESANRAKDQFIATISHELRTPLAAILAWAQLIRTGKLNEESQRAGIKAIEECALTQSQLINDLLDVSRIVTGKMVLKPSRTDIAGVLHSALEAVRPAAEKKGVTLQEHLDGLSLDCMVDPIRLKQVFWNLLSNAIKFTPGGGRIEVMIESVTRASGPEARVRISDSGEGISPEVLPSLFRRFSQGDSSTTRSHGGLGLGLSLTRSLLELQGGQVEASSAGLGKGSTFTVFLPLCEEAARAELPAPKITKNSSGRPMAKGLPLSGIRVLFADDEASTRAAILATLASSGAKARAAGSALEALDFLHQEKFDLLLTDLSMPQIDGFELLRRIRSHADAKIRNLPAVAFSALVGPDIAMDALTAGFQAYLPKPLDIEVLSKTVREVAGAFKTA